MLQITIRDSLMDEGANGFAAFLNIYVNLKNLDSRPRPGQ